MKTLRFSNKFVNSIVEGIKTSTIRRHDNYCRFFEVNGVEFKIVGIRKICFGNIDKGIAFTEGYLHEDLLKDELVSIYPDLGESSELYYLCFERNI